MNGKQIAMATLLLRLAVAILCAAGTARGVAAAVMEGGGVKAARPSRVAGDAIRAVPMGFDEALESALARRAGNAKGKGRAEATSRPYDGSDGISRRILNEYGAVFLAGDGVLTPPVCVFEDEGEVASFQAAAFPVASEIGGVRVELQPRAMRALLAAREEALAAGLDITPRDGPESARRSYADTVRLWSSRLLPALDHWARLGRLTTEEAARIKSLPARAQVGAVLELEALGVFFSRDFSKSILHSVAAPGTSQHLSLLAFDAGQYADVRVRKILSRHGWFRTVRNDMPHFTYLGLPEQELPARGLKQIRTAEGEFWMPNVSPNLSR